MRDKVLILDIDETLVYSSEESLSYKEDFKIDNYFVYKRPGLENFLLGSDSLFKVAIWTASSADYAYAMIERIFPSSIKIEFIFTQERCNFRYNHETGQTQIIKPLKKVRRRGYSISKMVVIDDLPETFQNNYGNAILVRKFCGEKKDEELFALLNYLKTIADARDIRMLDKRNWRHQIGGRR